MQGPPWSGPSQHHYFPQASVSYQKVPEIPGAFSDIVSVWGSPHTPLVPEMLPSLLPLVLQDSD